MEMHGQKTEIKSHANSEDAQDAIQADKKKR